MSWNPILIPAGLKLGTVAEKKTKYSLRTITVILIFCTVNFNFELLNRSPFLIKYVFRIETFDIKNNLYE